MWLVSMQKAPDDVKLARRSPAGFTSQALSRVDAAILLML
jgi:hypothetical protein